MPSESLSNIGPSSSTVLRGTPSSITGRSFSPFCAVPYGTPAARANDTLSSPNFAPSLTNTIGRHWHLGSPTVRPLDATYVHPAEFGPRGTLLSSRTTPTPSLRDTYCHPSLLAPSWRTLHLEGTLREAPVPPILLSTHDDVATHLDGASSLLAPDAHIGRHTMQSMPSFFTDDASMGDPGDLYVALAAVGDRPTIRSHGATSTSSPSTRTSPTSMTPISAHGWICDSGANKHYNSIRDEMLDLDVSVTGWVSGLGVAI